MCFLEVCAFLGTGNFYLMSFCRTFLCTRLATSWLSASRRASGMPWHTGGATGRGAWRASLYARCVLRTRRAHPCALRSVVHCRTCGTWPAVVARTTAASRGCGRVAGGLRSRHVSVGPEVLTRADACCRAVGALWALRSYACFFLVLYVPCSSCV